MMQIIEGGLPNNIAECMKELRQLVRRTHTNSDGTKAIDVFEILHVIHKWDAEDYFYSHSVRLDNNTVLNLHSNEH
jgi:hypothetical protein